MNHKTYLLQLAQELADVIGHLKDKIEKEIGHYSRNQIERLIHILERSKKREKLIKAGKLKEAILYLKQEESNFKRQLTKDKKLKLSKKESTIRDQEIEEAEQLLHHLHTQLG